ncbi:MAG TPA: alpha/beta hydrolase [Thermoanaerobaculia bacterium]|nr:alpha/beta hydrolase [Thermoanaerobaculia bacterium]
MRSSSDIASAPCTDAAGLAGGRLRAALAAACALLGLLALGDKPLDVLALADKPLAWAVGPAATGATGARKAERLEPCHVEGAGEELRCATYPVWEDRAARRGRKIGLRVVVLPALGPDPAPDPILFFAGGPGESAVSAGLDLIDDKELRSRRAIVLVDQRGTGRSNPLDCDLYGPGSHLKGGDRKLLAGPVFPPEAVHRCRQQLEKVADLRLYTTAIGMDDIDEVRAWLGYDKVNLVGGSYGTRAAQVYLRRHPRAVRSVVLNAVAPVDEPLPLHHAYAGKRAVDLLFAECAADPACHAAFPRLADELRAVLERVDRGIKVSIADPRTGRAVEVTPDRGLVAEGIRFMMYGNGARQVPLAIHQAYGGDLAQLVNLSIDQRSRLSSALSEGLFFSITCAEDIPFIDDAAAARETAGTLLGDYRIRQQKRACADWPRGSVPSDVHELVRSDVPVLLFSGERDPVTPPEFGARVASRLPNSLHLVMPHGAHGADGPCADRIVRDFLDRASVKGLDTSCLTTPPPTRFVLAP